MEEREQWIWLPEREYPHGQTTAFSAMQQSRPQTDGYTVAAFRREYVLPQTVQRLELRFSGDTAFRLFLNGTVLASGPVWPGGDFLQNDQPHPQHYATQLTLEGEQLPACPDGVLRLYTEVRMQPVMICEYSRGHGGFFLDGCITFADGTRRHIATDEHWQVQQLTAYTAPGQFDGTRPQGVQTAAQRIDDRWHTLTAPIPPCEERELSPRGGGQLRLGPRQVLTATLPFDKIVAGYLCLSADGAVTATAQLCENDDDDGVTEQVRFSAEGGAYRGFTLRSVGQLRLQLQNDSDVPVCLKAALVTSCYPVTVQAHTVTSDERLNGVLEVCAHTLRWCRQSHHLDSPRHCEPLACTGDYYIEMLMTAFTFGDQRLSAFDVRRTAELLRYRDGRMFHTTYSLIWVQMLWDVYRLTGETALLTDCEVALELLLARFETYLGENGLIETPPDYMFIDWLCPDGISMHHPPKALGQTCLNLFYFGALQTAAAIYTEIGQAAAAGHCADAARRVRTAILQNLWDAQRGLFFEGSNTPTPEKMLYQYLPQNVEKRYYRRHANILAAYFGILPSEDCRALLRRVWQQEELGEVQPYFLHFWLDAIYRCGLREEYTLPLLEKWKTAAEDCPMGLPEGFYKPEPTYRFDHSHAWGGTPAYAVPLALTGLEIVQPGFGRIRLSPSLLGLEHAEVQIPAPQGMITVRLCRGQKPEISLPQGIDLETE